MFAHKMKFILIQCVAVILLIFLTVIRETRCADDNLSPRSEANPVSVKILEEGTKNLNVDELQRTKTPALKEVGWSALKTVGISAAVLGGVSLAVPAMGFTAAGVAAGSLAASYQIPVLGVTIASGSATAVLESVKTAAVVFAGVYMLAKKDNDSVRKCFEYEKETCNLKKNSVCKISEENKPECICMEPYEEMKDEGYKTICQIRNCTEKEKLECDMHKRKSMCKISEKVTHPQCICEGIYEDNNDGTACRMRICTEKEKRQCDMHKRNSMCKISERAGQPQCICEGIYEDNYDGTACRNKFTYFNHIGIISAALSFLLIILINLW